MSQDMPENVDDLSDVSMPEESDEDESETEAPSKSYGLRDGGISADRTQSEASSVDLRHIERNEHESKATQAGFGTFPPELWQHIFMFTPPMKLGALLRVSKGINSLLDPSSLYPMSETPTAQSSIEKRTPDEVWQHSRKIFRPQMPSPMKGMTELSMWRLMCSMRCAFCKKKSNALGNSAFNDKWHCGPGENGVRPIWSFCYNSCGPCLRNQTVKEIDLLLSGSVPSALLSALPLILFTNELHVVASTSVHPGQHPPSSLQVTKYYLKSDVEGIKEENVRIKEFGNAAAEEWVKGLSDKGKAKRLDIARWERWEASGGLQRILKDEPDIMPGAFPPTQPSSLPPRPATFHGYSGFGQAPHAGSAYALASGVVGQTGELPLKFGLQQRLDSPLLHGAYAPPGTQKTPRTKEEIERLKLLRRIEIERRCSELNPPILPSVLAHMPSFQASLHIIKPLDDTAWDMLKPRLLAQRADAEQREKERLASTQIYQQHQAERQSLNDHPQCSAESIEREWEETQTIVRKRIAMYSDEVIRDGWASGTRVTKDLSSRFAAEVLMYVRKRFYAEIAKDDAAARAAGVPPLLDPPNGPFTRKLTLENMRWVYETKIKPYTDKYRKEVFLCNACDAFQWFTMEGVCQHYMSHHTSYLNSGSTMVNWRAEWPEEPLFNPEPHLARKPKVAASDGHTSPKGTAALAPTEAYPPPLGISPLQAITHLPSASTYPPQVLQAYQSAHLSEPYNPPPVGYMVSGLYHLYPPTTQPRQHPGAGGAMYAPFYQHPPPDGFPNPPMPMQQSSVLYGQGYLNPSTAPADPTLLQHSLHQKNMTLPLVGPLSHIPPPVYRTEEYKAQLKDMTSIARALWNETAGAKDMPGSVRVHVILFHLLQRLRESYTEDPPLSMFVDGIQNAKEMRIVRNVNGIACKTCTKENSSKPVNPYTISTKTSAPDRKLYSLPQLVNHFQSTHSEASDGASVPDWRTDMVELPDLRKIRSLKDSADMDEHKLRLLIEALPEAFEPETPMANSRDLPPSVDKHGSYYKHGQVGDSPPSVDKHDSYYQPNRSPTPITQLDADVRKLFNPVVDNYPRQGFRRRPSRAVGGSVSGPSNMKRKATSPIGSRRVPIQPIPADSIRYFDSRVVEREDYPTRRNETEMRPEYNHQAVDLSRLLANAGRANPAQEHNYIPLGTHQSCQGVAEADRFLDTIAPPRSREALMSLNRRPRDVAIADPSTEGVDQREGRTGAKMIHDDQGDNAQQIQGQDGTRRSPAGGYPCQSSPEPADPRYLRERTTFVETRTIHSQAPRDPQYADGNRASSSPVYVVEGASRGRHYRAVSPGELQYNDEPRPLLVRVEENKYGQRQQYYDYPEERVRPRQIYPQPRPEQEVEYVRVKDAAGDYLIARPKARRQPVYTRYEDAVEHPYEDSRRRAVHEDGYMPAMHVSHVSQKFRQMDYGDEARLAAAGFEEDGGEPIVKYEERPRPVVPRVDDGRAQIAQDESPRPRQQVVYEDDLNHRQPIYQRRPINGPPMSRDDPAYYEEYDPRNPAPLPEAPRRAQKPE